MASTSRTAALAITWAIGLALLWALFAGLAAWGDSLRPDGKSTRLAVRGDSVAFDLPGEVLRQIRVFGGAWVAGAPEPKTGTGSVSDRNGDATVRG